MSTSPQYSPVPMPSFSASPVKDFLLKSAIFSMSLASLMLTGFIVWSGIGDKGGTVAPPSPNPPVVVNPPPPSPNPPPLPLPGPSPVPTPQPLPAPTGIMLNRPGMNVIRISVGDKETAYIANVVPAGTPLVNPNDLTAGYYPITATVDGP